MTRLLVVDDSALMRKLLTDIFGSVADFQVETAIDGSQAIAKLHRFKPDVITLDINMPGMHGLACLDRIMIERPTPVVMISSLTGEGAEETIEALLLGAVDFAQKPIGPLSLEIDSIADELVEKVLQAAKARVSKAARLSERLRVGKARPTKNGARSKPNRPLERRTGDGLVLVGTSTGGPPALDQLLTPLPRTFAWPILIAQHMPASFTGSLARRLDRICELQVREVSTPQLLEPGHAYIGRGDADLIVARRASGLFAMAVPLDTELHWHPSVDRLVSSALDHVPPQQLIGVLMTGMGNDGADAMTRLHASGGITIAEDEASSVVWGMPGALVKGGGASLVTETPKIARHLLHLVGAR